MARINLLPWREERRRLQRAEYLTVLGITAAAALLVWGLVHFHYSERVAYQQERNAYLTAEIGKLDRQIKEIEKIEQEKARLIARMKAIESLQASRPIIVHLFDALVKTLPEGLYLTELAQKGTGITLKGVAESNARVSGFMRNIETSEWLSNPRLQIIQTTEVTGRRLANFTLTAQQVIPQVEAEGDTP